MTNKESKYPEPLGVLDRTILPLSDTDFNNLLEKPTYKDMYKELLQGQSKEYLINKLLEYIDKDINI